MTQILSFFYFESVENGYDCNYGKMITLSDN